MPHYLYCSEEIAESETAAEVTEEVTEPVDNNPGRKKKESTRKKSIPLLDQEHRMSAVMEVGII